MSVDDYPVYPTSAEQRAYDAGRKDMAADWNEQDTRRGECVEVRKIACALIRNNTEGNDQEIAENAWSIWRAIKAGQEGRKP